MAKHESIPTVYGDLYASVGMHLIPVRFEGPTGTAPHAWLIWLRTKKKQPKDNFMTELG